MRWMSIWLLWIGASMAVDEYLQVLRSVSMSVNAAIMAPLVLDGMVQTRMAFRS